MLPGVDVTAGSETEIPPIAFTVTGAEYSVAGTAFVAIVFEITGVMVLCKPRNSAAESIKAKREPPAPNAVKVITKAASIPRNAKPLTREERGDFWLLNMI